MILLINKGSASASEIWRERSRTTSAPTSSARITYGKGSGQQIYPIEPRATR